MKKLSPANATRMINQIAKDPSFNRRLTGHAREQIVDRGIVMGDVLNLLQFGFVHAEPHKSGRGADWKYKIEGRTPNSGHRKIAAIVVPNQATMRLTIITVMWVDER